jgi:hypothetical protein
MSASMKALGACFALGLVLLPDLAAAQPYPTYRGDRRYEDEYSTRGPARGYSGWGSGPLRGYFCDYQRTPVRRCGRNGCRVVSWRLRQYCY